MATAAHNAKTNRDWFEPLNKQGKTILEFFIKRESDIVEVSD